MMRYWKMWLSDVWPLLVVIALAVLFVGIARPEEPKELGEKRPTVKPCPCSRECTCGCNERGGKCRCGPVITLPAVPVWGQTCPGAEPAWEEGRGHWRGLHRGGGGGRGCRGGH